MALSASQQQMAADLGNLVSQMQGALAQAQKVATNDAAAGATTMGGNARTAAEALAAALPALVQDLAVMNDLAVAP